MIGRRTSLLALATFASCAAWATWTPQAGDEWIPFEAPPVIAPGTALDFSSFRPTGRLAGEFGRVVVRGDHFELEGRPGVPVRFYGVNTTGSMNTPEPGSEAAFAANAARMGYNALRIHHHDDELTRDLPDGTTLYAPAMAKFDALAAACITNGLYLTTDLHVSRRHIPWRLLGEDRAGLAGGEMKLLVRFHEGAFSNYLAFARNFLTHVNPHTGRSYAEEPALSWISLINEAALGEFSAADWNSFPCYREAWRRFLQEKGLSLSDEIPGDLTKLDAPEVRAFRRFMLEAEERFVGRVKRFLRDELKCRALVTGTNGVQYPQELQVAMETVCDYVDDHFYGCGQWFPSGDYKPPAHLNNPLPFNPPAWNAGYGAHAVIFHRVFGKPFTVSEFNYGTPNKYRNVGGLLAGTFAGLQDWNGVWRFCWAEGYSPLSHPETSGFACFHTSGDPVMLATERAMVCLFLRGDVKPLRKTYAFVLPERTMRDPTAPTADAVPNLQWLAWYAKTGTKLDEAPPDATWSRTAPEAFLQTEAEMRAQVLPGTAADEWPPAGNGDVMVDMNGQRFAVATPGTCGCFAEAGTVAAGSLEATFDGHAALWVSALDGTDIGASRRMLLTHLPDVLQTDITFEQPNRQIMLSWGRLPFLMHRARATVSIAVGEGAFEVWALRYDGTRVQKVPAQRNRDGRLEFAPDTALVPGTATWLYEIADVTAVGVSPPIAVDFTERGRLRPVGSAQVVCAPDWSACGGRTDAVAELLAVSHLRQEKAQTQTVAVAAG